MPRSRGDEMVFLSIQEVLRLSDAVTHPPIRAGGGETRRSAYPEYGLLVRFAALTGLRAGEIGALRIGRVDPIRARVEVAESVTVEMYRYSGSKLNVRTTFAEKVIVTYFWDVSFVTMEMSFSTFP